MPVVRHCSGHFSGHFCGHFEAFFAAFRLVSGVEKLFRFITQKSRKKCRIFLFPCAGEIRKNCINRFAASHSGKELRLSRAEKFILKSVKIWHQQFCISSDDSLIHFPTKIIRRVDKLACSAVAKKFSLAGEQKPTPVT